MILAILDTEHDRVTVYERDPRPGARLRSGVRIMSPEELAKRSAAGSGIQNALAYDDELAHAAMCGMFPAPLGPEDYGL
jgi:hypothetical protein